MGSFLSMMFNKTSDLKEFNEALFDCENPDMEPWGFKELEVTFVRTAGPIDPTLIGTANMLTASKISDAKKEEIEKEIVLVEKHFRTSKEFSNLDDNRRYLARVRDLTNLNKKKDQFCYVLERIGEVFWVQFALTGKQGHVDVQNLEKMCYTGVFETDSGKFKAEFQIQGHTFYCGVYDTKLQAARARDAVLLEVGTPTQRKKLNFLPAGL